MSSPVECMLKISWPRAIKRLAYLDTFETSASVFHFSLRRSRYSRAARSLESMIPSFSCARAFHIRTLPSSEPDNTNLASAVKSVDMTLNPKVNTQVSRQTSIRVLPLHAFCMIHLWSSAFAFLPYSHCPVPPTTDEMCPSWTPITTHDCGNVGFVDLSRVGKGTNIEGVQIMIFRSKEDGRRECRRPSECIASHLQEISNLTSLKRSHNSKKLACMTIRRSAFPVRISYSVNVLSEPILASTDDSDMLKRTAETVSEEVGKVRFEMAALLQDRQREFAVDKVREHTLFHPIFAQCSTQ